MKQFITLLVIAICIVGGQVLPAFAGGWPGDPTKNIQIIKGQLEKSHPSICPDGKGGEIIVWQDARALGSFHIWAQRIDINGNKKWGSPVDTGLLICNANDNQINPQVVSDNNGGAYVVWLDARKANNGNDTDIYAQYIDSTGKPGTGWPALSTNQGLAVVKDSAQQTNFTVISDGLNGAFVAWEDSRLCFKYDTTLKPITGGYPPHVIRVDTNFKCNPAATASASTSPRVFLQHMTPDGLTWKTDGVASCDSVHKHSQTGPRLVADTAGGVYVIWSEFVSGTTSLYWQNIRANGYMRYDATGMVLCTHPSSKANVSVVSDRKNGFFAVWDDGRNTGATGWDLYAQHVNPSFTSAGNLGWLSTGDTICLATQDQQNSSVLCDTNGNLIVVWQDQRNLNVGPDYFATDLFGQLISVATGKPLWATGGIALIKASRSQTNQILAFDTASNGFWMCWMDFRAGTGGASDIYGTRIKPDGGAVWSAFPTGVAICTAANNQDQPAMCLSGNGMVSVWHDGRSPSTEYQGSIYAQKVFPDGTLPVEISSFTAVAAGEPGRVNISWKTATEINTAGFELLRQRDDGDMISIAAYSTTQGLQARGVAGAGATYSFVDNHAAGERCAYKLVSIDNDGSRSEYGPVIVRLAAPTSLSLDQNFPNPFSHSTVVGFALPHAADVTIRITDMLGREVSASMLAQQTAGWHSYTVNGSAMIPGTYFLVLESAGSTLRQRMTIAR